MTFPTSPSIVIIRMFRFISILRLNSGLLVLATRMLIKPRWSLFFRSLSLFRLFHYVLSSFRTLVSYKHNLMTVTNLLGNWFEYFRSDCVFGFDFEINKIHNNFASIVYLGVNMFLFFQLSTSVKLINLITANK